MFYGAQVSGVVISIKKVINAAITYTREMQTVLRLVVCAQIYGENSLNVMQRDFRRKIANLGSSRRQNLKTIEVGKCKYVP